MSFRGNILTILAICLSTSCVIAQQAVSPNPYPGDSTSRSKFYVMSMEELLNVVVNVASKDDENIADAPGMVTSYSAKDIERFGYYTLKDLANVTSGYSTFSAFGETNLETRGQKAGSWEVNKHLLLVDGIPINHGRANSAPLEYQIPLFFAGNTEFLRGPGSALYGTSAFFGVMNIKSKQLEEEGTLFEWKSSYGELGNGMRLMSNAMSKTEEGHLEISASYHERGFSGDSLGYQNMSKHFDNDESYFMKVSYTIDKSTFKGFSLGAILTNRNSHGGEFWGAQPSPTNYVSWKQYVGYLKYERDISSKVHLNAYSLYNLSREQSSYIASWANYGLGSIPLKGYSFATVQFESQAELRYAISDKSSLVGGVNFNTREENSEYPNSYAWNITAPLDTSASTNYSSEFSIPSPGARVNICSAYAQYRNEYDFLEGLLVTAGLRYDNGFSSVGNYSQVSPRLALVQKISKRFNVKVLYGQALRVPLSKELGLNGETINAIETRGGTGNTSDIPNVGPEVIRSLEAGINYTVDKFSASVSLFTNQTENSLDGAQYFFIASNGDSIQPNYFRNLEYKIRANGFEYDLQYLVKDRMKFVFNHSYAIAQIGDSLNFENVPTHKTNFILTYNVKGKVGFSTTLISRNRWAYRVEEGVYDESLLLSRDNRLMKGYRMIDLNILMPITSNFGLEFQLRNLLNTRWKQPSLLGPSSMIPLQRRNFMMSLSVKF